MRWSESYLFTVKETPADAEIPSHRLLIRGGYVKKLAPGIFTYGPLFVKALRKFEGIVRDELGKKGALELLMPMVQPRELWEETGRWKKMGDGLLKFKNRNQHDFCLGATHEEVITDYVRNDVKSYRDLPINLFQIQTKFRDEIRPRFGLMRGREFIMKDAYSFDRDFEGAQISYKKMHEAYTAIFSRLGLDFRVVQADAGQIGGDQSHEFQILAEAGEDALMVSTESDFAANIEICPAPVDEAFKNIDPLLPIEEFSTPGQRTIADLARSTGLAEKLLVKTLFVSASDDISGDTSGDVSKIKPVAILLRGSDEANPIKLKNLLGLANPPLLLTDAEVKNLTSAAPGSCGPVGLNIPVYVDQALKGHRNFIVGANKDDVHFKNVNFDRDFKVEAYGDYRLAYEGLPSPDGKGHLKQYRGIEVGHIFYLGTTYSKAMSAQYLNEQGKAVPIEMGCYGIGMTRTVQAAIEQSHDGDGIIWPLSIAPFALHICLLDPDNEDCKVFAEKIYSSLQDKGYEVLLDDRNERPGVKFKDADLLGMPLRLTVGGRGMQNGEVEIVTRSTKKMDKVSPDTALKTILSMLESMSERA